MYQTFRVELKKKLSCPPGDDAKEIPTVKLPSVPHMIRIEINVAAKHSPEELQKLRMLKNGACHSSAVEIVAGVRVCAKTLSWTLDSACFSFSTI